MIGGGFGALAAREIFLNPGELGCGHAHEVFGTLLGSCVAITLWHPHRRLGAICHFILPEAPALRPPDGRYGRTAFAQMRADLAHNRVPLRECEAKIFGGGAMFSESPVQDVGARNIAMARRLLADAGLAPVAENVGGDGYRRLYFDVGSGAVWIKFDWLENDTPRDLVL